MNLPGTPQQVVASSAGVASANTDAIIVTTASLTTAAGSSYTLTLNSPAITPGSLVMASVANGSNSAGSPDLFTVTPGNGVAAIVVNNAHASAAFNGTLKISVIVFN
jgi:hypothetical protein